jgi:hypothetical protein
VARPARARRPSFAAVAEAELDAVHGYLLFLTGNRSVAEDLTGETLENGGAPGVVSIHGAVPRARGSAASRDGRRWITSAPKSVGGAGRSVMREMFRREERRLLSAA